MIKNTRKIARELKGWQSISDIRKKLKISQGSAYVYAHKLNRAGFVQQKIKKPRGTFYRISPIPKPLPAKGILEETELSSELEEFSSQRIQSEQKIPYLINKYKEENNTRFLIEAEKFIRKIKNWQKLYFYLKAYKVKNEFAKFYKNCRKKVAKCPSMPKRYRRLLNVS